MSIVTAPERLATYLKNPAGKRLPFSCTLCVLNDQTDLGEVIRWATLSLKAGAGVKLVISDTFRLPDPHPVSVELVIDPQHPDYDPEGVLVPSTELDFDFAPEDSIEGIIESWDFLMSSPEPKVRIDLSNLRPRDTVNSDGLLASGPNTFALVYEGITRYRSTPSMFTLLRLFGILNDVILRGGYKKGIITSAIEDTSPYYQEYLKVPLVSLRGAHKKGVILSGYPENVDQICELVNYESMFLQKATGRNTYANVCMGILLADRGTCLINRVNLGQLESLSDLIPAFEAATTQAIEAHVDWRKQQPERAASWASIEVDNQVAVDVMGLSNLLRRLGITYAELIEALEGGNTKATELVNTLQDAYKASVVQADNMCDFLNIPRMERLHTVEPAQAHSYRTTDSDGYTTARGIWPPFSQIVNRYSQSSSEPVQTYNHGQVEHLTPDEHFRLCAGWMRLMETSGRPHAISYDTWEDFTPEVFGKWWGSPLQTLYYNMSKDYATRGYARKRFSAPNLCSSCTD